MKKEISLQDKLYLAGLLHDVGKFWQRADESFDSRKSQLSETVRNNVGMICKLTQKGYYSHQHVLWTQEFIDRKEKGFPFLKDITSLSAYHHNPSNKEQAIVQIADWWASGIDRTYTEDAGLELGKQKFRRQPLGNIFSVLSVQNFEGKGIVSENRSSFKLNPINIIEGDFFPTEYSEDFANAKKEYSKLWQSFYDEFDLLPSGTFNTFTNSLFYLLKKYFWSIPAATNEDFPFTSLFDHMKVTAAIAWCLQKYSEEIPNGVTFNSSKNRINIESGHYPLLLVCIDLSGIQKFIYDISSKYAAKSLRGRSFYLQAILDDISRELLHQTGAFYGNIIYSSGGKFFALLPNTPSIKSAIEKMETELINRLWEKHRETIYLCIGSVAFTYHNEIKDGKPNISVDSSNESIYLGDLWRLAAEKASEKKKTKFKQLLTNKELYKDFFEPSDTGGDVSICQVTGLELDVVKQDDEDNKGTVSVSKSVVEQREIGKKLPQHKYLAFATEESFHSNRPFRLITGHGLVLEKEMPKIENAEVFRTLTEGVPNFLDQQKSPKNTYGFRYFGGTSFPMNNGVPKTYEELVGDSRFKRLGVLRMDVDNLGQLFIKGFDKPKASFSAYATLSGMLDLFFSGYINTIRNNDDFKDWVAIVYSGGDDLFAVGRWDKAIHFAHEVQSCFKRFTGRPDITLSAGIELVSQKFPIAKAADLAGVAEKSSKDHFWNSHTKNSLTLLGIAVNWDYEYPRVVEIKDKLISWLNSGLITKGLLMQLQNYYIKLKAKNRASPGEGENPQEDLSWKWQAAYNLARRRGATKDKEKQAALDELKAILFTEIYDNKLRFEAFALACKWAELENRMNN